jgi:hypothetical protein
MKKNSLNEIGSGYARLYRMKGVYRILRVIGAYCVGALLSMVCFGLMLGLVWLPWLPQSNLYKLVSLFFVAGLSTLVGGIGIGLTVGDNQAFHAAIFGLGFGLLGSAYTLGLDPAVIGYTLATGIIALIGGVTSSSLREKLQPSPKHGAV